MPYPGYSWSMTQHIGPVTDQVTMYALLKAAHTFSNSPNYTELITQHLIDLDMLTPNLRQDAQRPQAWRDYQQVLPELGLIVSTRFTEGVVVTPAGLMWLDGIIGCSELLSTQCLRYQYPNGHKQDISPALRRQLASAGIQAPQTRTELDASFGILLKPAVLLLRILITLNERGEFNKTISTRECLASLVPLATNHQWPQGLNSVLRYRHEGLPEMDTRRLRHIQEWFRLLDLTDIFTVNSARISLTQAGLDNISSLVALCNYHENESNFWVPSNFERNTLGWSWFNFYGNPDVNSQWSMPDNFRDLSFIETNFPEGVEESEDWAERPIEIDRMPMINLRDFDFSSHNPPESEQQGIGINPDNILRGQIRRQRSTRLHEEIVSLVAKKLQDRGYCVFDDPSSVDLIASKGEKEAIIEVKTVTPRNLTNRLRLGLGQISEYRYRRHLQTGSNSIGVLVISSAGQFPEWYTGYLENDIGIGLVSRRTADSFFAHTTGQFEDEIAMQ